MGGDRRKEEARTKNEKLIFMHIGEGDGLGGGPLHQPGYQRKSSSCSCCIYGCNLHRPVSWRRAPQEVVVVVPSHQVHHIDVVALGGENGRVGLYQYHAEGSLIPRQADHLGLL